MINRRKKNFKVNYDLLRENLSRQTIVGLYFFRTVGLLYVCFLADSAKVQNVRVILKSIFASYCCKLSNFVYAIWS